METKLTHDSIDTGELPQENHDIGIDDGTAGARDCEEIQPGQGASTRFFIVEIFEHGMFHDEELFAVFGKLGATNTLPDIEGFEGATFVHEETGGLGHEEHARKHDGRENQGGTEHVTPAAAL